MHMHSTVSFKSSALGRIVKISVYDHAKILRSVELFAESNQLIGDLDCEQFTSDRTRALAVSHLVKTLVRNLTKLSGATKKALYPIQWQQLTPIYHNLPSLRLDTGFAEVWRVVRDLLPPLMEQIDAVVSATKQRRLQLMTAKSDESDDVSVCIPDMLRKVDLLYPQSFVSQQVLTNKFSRFATQLLHNSTDPLYEMYRAQIEIWFQNMQIEHHTSLRSRLQDTDQIAHTAAFYELFFHEYFCRRGIDVRYEPDLVDPNKPDFLVNHHDGSFILEVTSAWTDVDVQNIVEDFNLFLSDLDRLPIDYLLSVSFKNFPLPFGLDRFRRDVLSWLDPCTPATHMKQQYFASVEHGFQGTISARPRNGLTTAGAVSEWFLPPQKESDTWLACQRAIHKQIPFRSRLNGPLVVAVCGRENTYVSDQEMCALLFGHVLIDIDCRGNCAVTITQNGPHALTAKPYISAILFCNRRFDRTCMSFDMKVVHNPAATYSLPASSFADLPQLLSTGGKTLAWFAATLN